MANLKDLSNRFSRRLMPGSVKLTKSELLRGTAFAAFALWLLTGSALIAQKSALGPAQNPSGIDPALLSKATSGDAVAQTQVGIAFRDGKTVEQNFELAAEWLSKAAERGAPEAQVGLADLYMTGRGVELDYLQAAVLFRKAADKGNATAELGLGILYSHGHGVAQDFAQAVTWYRKAAEQGNASAENNLGDLYEQGNGVKENYPEALIWFQKAASQGNAVAQFNLAWLYAHRFVLKQSYPEAATWYRKAADQGYAKAQNNLGVACELGRGIERNHTEAMALFDKAAKNGSVAASTNLALIGSAQGVVNGSDLHLMEESALRGPILSTREIAKEVHASLVKIVTIDHDGNPFSQGSGFFVTPTLVATNMHVMKHADKAYVKLLSDETSYPVKIATAFSLRHDIIILEVPSVHGIPLELSTDDVAPGDDVIVAGNPEGLESSLSKGIVSGLRPQAGLFQIDASISHGSSGGPVVNVHGEVVGMVVSSLTAGQNLNFAIPATYLLTLRKVAMTVPKIGAFSQSDLECNGLSSSVRSVTTKKIDYAYEKSSGRYVARPIQTTAVESFNSDGRSETSIRFEKGVQAGRRQLEYTQDGLIKRSIDTGADGTEKSKDYRPDQGTPLAHCYSPGEHEFTNNNGDKEVDRFDSLGRKVLWRIPSRDSGESTEYDDQGRPTLVSSITAKQANYKMRFRYENNGEGDWIIDHETIWWSSNPDAGFVPLSDIFREIAYRDGSDR